MGRFHVEVRIDAPIDHAWSIARDADRIADFNPYLDIRHVCGALDHVGTTFEATVHVLGTRHESVGVVREVEAGRLLHIEGLNRDGQPTSDWVFRFTPAGDATTATLDAEYQVPGGFVGNEMDRVLFERAFERAIRHMCDNFRRPRRHAGAATRLSSAARCHIGGWRNVQPRVQAPARPTRPGEGDGEPWSGRSG